MELKYGMRGVNNFKKYPPLILDIKVPDHLNESA